MPDTPLKSEYAFTLPRGLVDSEGNVHREGTMRLATARDEIEPLRSAEVRSNEAYLSVLLLARTVTRIGGFTQITPELVENLYAADLAYLQTLYRQINEQGKSVITMTCPECSTKFDVDLAELGES